MCVNSSPPPLPFVALVSTCVGVGVGGWLGALWLCVVALVICRLANMGFWWVSGLKH